MINTARRDTLSAVIKYLSGERKPGKKIFLIWIISRGPHSWIIYSPICLHPDNSKFPFWRIWIISWLNLEYFLIVNQTLISKQPLKPGYSSCNKWCFFQQRVDINDDPRLRYSWAGLSKVSAPPQHYTLTWNWEKKSQDVSIYDLIFDPRLDLDLLENFKTSVIWKLFR